MVGCESRTLSSMSPAQRHAPFVAAFCPAAFASAAHSFSARRIRRRIGSAMACSARSRANSSDDMDELEIARKSMGVNLGLVDLQFSSHQRLVSDSGNYLTGSGVKFLCCYAVHHQPVSISPQRSKQGSSSAGLSSR